MAAHLLPNSAEAADHAETETQQSEEALRTTLRAASEALQHAEPEKPVEPALDDEPDAATPKRSRENSKQARMIEMLKRPEGATVNQIAAEMGWQKHTVRGAISGALRKKLGLNITSGKVDGKRIYRIED